ncbi:Equisetin cluster transcription factor eqxF [Colletotrichum siamense]|uniref:Equisetin cluster transcription factor eqxF n=1 Tax=Colletotrichum siamense TaxID=690259 RepID=UPI001872C8DE|nr:Equisetin cluster transcription factor eqxF [Colletotrichum siamense]KAF5511083.1 Equisetin cluster transcription factor eqxF [Colletotrichum siamense]
MPDYPPSNPLSPAQSGASVEPGTTHISSQGTTSFASPHWEAIMDEISDLKDQFRRTDGSRTSIEPTDSHSPDRKTSNYPPLLPYGSMQPLSKEDLTSALPERSVTNPFIFQYFNGISILPARVAHPSRFLEQYEDFWSNPSAVSLSWLGLLYGGVLSLSHFFSSDPGHRGSQPQPKYLKRLIQCLVAADYVHGGPCILECLIHYCLMEFYFNPVTEVGHWMVAGMMAQLAFRMG